MAKLKSLSIEKIADTILKELSKADKRNKKVYIPDILEKKKIYYSKEIVDSVVNLLEKKDFIKEISDSTPSAHSSYSKEFDPDPAKVLLNVDIVIREYQLTKKGLHFVNSRQQIDSSKVNYVQKFKSWWQSKFWIVVIIVIIAILLYISKILSPWIQVISAKLITTPLERLSIGEFS